MSELRDKLVKKEEEIIYDDKVVGGTERARIESSIVDSCVSEPPVLEEGGSDSEEEDESEEGEEDESDSEEDDGYAGSIKTPDRDMALSLLSKDFIELLEKNVKVLIKEEGAKKCFTEERSKFVLQNNPEYEPYYMTDSNGYTHLFWTLKGPSKEYILEDENRQRSLQGDECGIGEKQLDGLNCESPLNATIITAEKLELSRNGCTQRIKPVIVGSSVSGDSYQDESDSVEEEEGAIYFGMIKIPDREIALRLLSDDLRNRLEEEVTVDIEEEDAEKCLTPDRFKCVLETNPLSDDGYSLSDSGIFAFLYWYTTGPSEEHVLDEKTREILNVALGYIRDQFGHKLCWAYVACDMTSSYRVLHGLDEVFVPLCPLFLCMNVSSQKFEEGKSKALKDGSDHACYSHTIFQGLMYAKIHGIPREKQVEFDCCSETKPFIAGDDQELFKIKEVFRYETLEQALERVKQGYPVAASLLCFDGWDRLMQSDDENIIYTGPNSDSGGRYLATNHGVIIMDFKVLNGTKVAIIKCSNGETIGKHGFLAVDTEIMLAMVGGVETDDIKWCIYKPQHLLFEFYSIDVEFGSKPIIQVDPHQAQENLKYKVNLENFYTRDLLAPIYGGTVKASLEIGGELTSRVSMEKPESLEDIPRQLFGSGFEHVPFDVASAPASEMESEFKVMKKKQEFAAKSASQRGRNDARMATTSKKVVMYCACKKATEAVDSVYWCEACQKKDEECFK